MEDLTLADELFSEDFRLVPAPAVQCPLPSELNSERTVPNKVQTLLSISSRYGYVFVALRNSICVYTTESLSSKKGGNPVSTVTLEPSEHVLSLQLIFQDRLLLVHVRPNFGEVDGELLAFDALKLVDGVRHELSSLNGTSCSSFAAFDAIVPFVSVITPGKGVRAFKLTNSCRELWSKPDDATSSEAPICLSFSDDGAELAICTRRGSVQILDSETGNKKTTLKEVESGWTPVSVAYVTRNSMKQTNSSEVLVCYQNEGQVCCVIWLLTDGKVVGNTYFDALFFPDIDAIGDGNMHTFCLPVEGWDVAVLANSCSCDVKLIVLVNENWVYLTLDEGKEFSFPLDDGDQSYPLGFVLDYTDTRMVPKADDRGNPMPRFVTLTSADRLWSVWVIDDKDDVVCNSVKEKRPISTADPLPLGPAVDVRSTSSVNLNRGGEPKSHSTATESEPESDLHLPSGNTFSSFAVGESLGFESSSVNLTTGAPKTQLSAFGNMRGMSTSFGIASNTEQAENKESSQTALGRWGMFSSFGLEGSETGATDQNIPKSFASGAVGVLSDALTPDMSESINWAKDNNAVYQVKSILTGMEREIKHVRAHKDEAERCVELSRLELEHSIGELKTLLRSLLDLDTEYWRREKDSRVLVNDHLKAIIEVGQKFEEMNLLNALLSANDDARPLPAEAQDEDRALNKKESAIADRLDEIERKIESRNPDMNRSGRLSRSASKAATSQHVYSSISLQAIRITRVRAVLVSLENQLRYALEEDENRVANSGLARSRLERLSRYTNGNSASTPHVAKGLSSPSSRSMRTLQESVRKLNVNSSGTSRLTSELERNSASNQFEPPVIRASAAIALRKLAMRKGRERITAPEKIVVTKAEAPTDQAQETTIARVPEVVSARAPDPTPSFGAPSLFGAQANPSQFKIHPTNTQSAPSFGSSTPKRTFGSFNSSESVPLKQDSSSKPPVPSTLFASSAPPAPPAPAELQPPPASSAPLAPSAASALVAPPASPPPPTANVNDLSASSEDVATSSVPFAAMPPASEDVATSSVPFAAMPPEPSSKPVSSVPETSSQRTPSPPPPPPASPTTSDGSLSPQAPAVVSTSTLPPTPPISNKEPSQVAAPEGTSNLPPPVSSTNEAEASASAVSEANGKQNHSSALASGAMSLVETTAASQSSFAASSAVTKDVKSVGFGASLSGVQSTPLFGSSTSSSGFGFGGNQSMTQSAFGTSEQSRANLSSANGQDANKSDFASAGSRSGFGFFGSGQSQCGFGGGSSQGGFGANATTTGFSSQSMFDSQYAFGTQSSQGAFGASSPSLFGQSNRSSGFGGGGNAFGSSTPSAFGSVPGATFGATSSFGMAANPTQSGAPSSFGVNSNPTGFGASLSGVQSSSLFAASTPPRTFGGFGGSGTPQGKESPFAQLSNTGSGFGGAGNGSASQSPFGQMSANQGGFGGGAQGGSLFGQGANTGGFGSGNGFGGGGFSQQQQQQQSQSNMFKSDAFTKRRA